jgi:hypothetical protein
VKRLLYVSDVSKLANEIVEKWTMIIRGDAEESNGTYSTGVVGVYI